MMNYVFIFEQIVQTCKIINVAAQVNLIIKKDFFVSYIMYYSMVQKQIFDHIELSLILNSKFTNN